jgi:hypothetical protein
LSRFHNSAKTVLSQLREQYPDTPFLALGQTVWWDEPMKAVLRLMLDEMGLGGKIILGVHDTDYFAKVHTRIAGQSRFSLLAHNDGSTKDMWSAAGEISRLFGSETYPTRHAYVHHGVPLNLLAERSEKDRLQFINEVTEAWGWRGLVYAGSQDLIVHNLPLHDLGDSILQMLSWGFEGTLETIVEDCCRQEAKRLAETLLGWVSDYLRDHPEKYLSNLYRHLFPRLFSLLLGSEPQRTEVDCTAHLLEFSPQTAHLPRFQFVDLFLNEKTRSIAARAYNEAVAGSEIYTLDKFGLGALPFDIVSPVYGRGTLRVTLRNIHIETRQPIRIPLKEPIQSVHQLAQILTRELGRHITLVGKAVALISMLAQEYIFVFNEEGSAYVRRTRKMNDYLRQHGINLQIHPILRLHYQTWDSLEVGQATLSLPDHLAATFGQRQITTKDFSQSWQTVCGEQQQLLEAIKRITKPRDMLRFLAERQGGFWDDLLAQYEQAKATLVQLREQALVYQNQVDDLYRELKRIKSEIREVERAKGDHFRATVEWTTEEEDCRAAFDARIGQLLSARRSTLQKINTLKSLRLGLERGAASEHRQTIAEIEEKIGMERLRLVQNALLTTTSLIHTNHRPTAWWLPMVDSSGRWFQRIAETTEVYTEPLLTS